MLFDLKEMCTILISEEKSINKLELTKLTFVEDKVIAALTVGGQPTIISLTRHNYTCILRLNGKLILYASLPPCTRS